MQFISVNEAANHLGITLQDISALEKKQLIQSHLFPGQRQKYFAIEEIEAFAAMQRGIRRPNPYRILKTSKHHYLRAIELFAGGGGMALGLENAGIQHELLVECDRHCIETLHQNRPQWNAIAKDIASVDFQPYRDRVDLVSGGFPCQAFSHAGYRRGLDDVRGTLFFEFARCLLEVQPKMAIAENVKGLLTHDKGKTLATMLSVFDDLGYRAIYQVVRAQFLDVPQKRERLFVFLTRKDLNLTPVFPTEKPYTISVREALENCPSSAGAGYNDRKRQIMQQVPPGGNWRDLPIEAQKDYMKGSYYKGGGRTGFARRLAWDEPALTLTCNPAQTQTERCHPAETRPLTVREYARLQTFPDDWEFAGSVGAQYKQIGNAIPVNLAYHIGHCAVAALLGNSPPPITSEPPKLSERQLTIPGLE